MCEDIESHRESRTGDLFDPVDNPLAKGLDRDGSTTDRAEEPAQP